MQTKPRQRIFIIVILSLFLVSLLALQPTIQAQSDEQAELDAILAYYVYDDEPGMVLWVSEGDEHWASAQGLASLEDGTPLAVDDSFRIGSVSKTFVATLVLQLVEEGELELDAPMSIWLDAEITDNIPYGDEITLRHLLTMQSGIFDYTESDGFWEDADANPLYAWTAEEALEYIFGEEEYFSPGAEFYYTNTNYILLEIIVQEVTSMTLGDAMAEYIFEPLGMDDSYMEDGANMSPDIVQGYGYYDNDDELDNVTYINEGVGLGDGGIISTAADLDIFIRALLTDDLLTEDTLAEMLAFDAESGYGLGISQDEFDEGATFIGHDGATAGFQSFMYYMSDADVVIIALTNNFDSEVIEDVADETAAAVIEFMAE